MFNLLSKHPNMKCHVSDLNSDLILAYLAIRDKVIEVIESLENHSKKYQKNKKQYYYHVRESEPTSQIEKVSRLPLDECFKLYESVKDKLIHNRTLLNKNVELIRFLELLDESL